MPHSWKVFGSSSSSRLERQSLSKTRIKTIEWHQEMFGREESQRGNARGEGGRARGIVEKNENEAKANQKVNIVYVVITRYAQQPRPLLRLIIWLARRVCRCRSWSRIWSDKDAIKCEQVCDMPHDKLLTKFCILRRTRPIVDGRRTRPAKLAICVNY